MYVPGTHKDILKIANKKKFPKLTSVVFCLEDSIKERDLSSATDNILSAIPLFNQSLNIYRFVRPRNNQVLETLLQNESISGLHGFVLPKISLKSLVEAVEMVEKAGYHHTLMITLETVEVFRSSFIDELATLLDEDRYKKFVSCIRIGGLDLLNILKIKRPKGVTIYDTPLKGVINNVVSAFKPIGYPVTSCAYEYFDDHETLSTEIDLDFAHGLMGKTIIHPNQLNIVLDKYMVCESDFNMAVKIMEPNAPSVFKLNGSMCEVATHKNWATDVLDRAKTFGVKNC